MSLREVIQLKKLAERPCFPFVVLILRQTLVFTKTFLSAGKFKNSIKNALF
jgi:hypothetical protein